MVALTEPRTDQSEDTTEEQTGTSADIFFRRLAFYNHRGIEELLPGVLTFVKTTIPGSDQIGSGAAHRVLYQHTFDKPEAKYLLQNDFLTIRIPLPGEAPNQGDSPNFQCNLRHFDTFLKNHREPQHLPLYWFLIASQHFLQKTFCRLPGMPFATDTAYNLPHICYLATVRSGIEALDAQIPDSFSKITPEFIHAYSRAAHKYQTEITCERMRCAKEHYDIYQTVIRQAYQVGRTQGFRDKERILYGPDAMRYFRPENNLSSPITFLFNDPVDQDTALRNDPQDPATIFKFFKCLAPALMPFDNVVLHSNDLGRAIQERYLRKGSARSPDTYIDPLNPNRAGASTNHTDLLYRFATRRIEYATADWDREYERWEIIPGTQFLGSSRLVIVPQPAWQTFYPLFWRDQIANNPDARLLHCLATGDGTHYHNPTKLFSNSPILTALNRPLTPLPNPAPTTISTKASGKTVQPRRIITVDGKNIEWVKEGKQEICVYIGPAINFPEEDVDVHIQIPHVIIPQGIVTQGNLIFDTPFACDVYTPRVHVSSILQEEKPEKNEKHGLSASDDIIVACSLQALDLAINSLQNIEVDGDLWCASVKADGNIRVTEHLMAIEIHSGGCVEANKITARDIISADRVFSHTETRAHMLRSLECFAAAGLKVPPEFEDPSGNLSKGVDSPVTVG
jgi:hypothetical protein